MNPKRTFPKGGVHPEENKLSSDKPIITFPIPKQVIIPLGQCLGAPAEAIVKKGDEVKVGQLIGTAKGFISANVHSSVSGKVTKIDEIMDHTGYRKPAIFIDVNGDEWLEGIDTSDKLVGEITLSREEIIKRLSIESKIMALSVWVALHSQQMSNFRYPKIRLQILSSSMLQNANHISPVTIVFFLKNLMNSWLA